MDKEPSMLIAGIRGASANTQEAEWLQKKERGRKGKGSFQGGSDVLMCLFDWYMEEEA